MKPGRPPNPKRSLAWKIASISFGVLLLLLGVVGLFLPILQGWLLILAGLAVLSPYSRRAKAILAWLKTKLHIGRKTDKDPPACEDTDVESEKADRDDRRASK